MEVKFKKLSKRAFTPTRGSEYAAGYDLYAWTGQALIHPGKTMRIDTGIAMEIPKGYFGAVFARSGLSTKMGLRPSNCVGVIDSDYRGEIMVPLYNDSDTDRTISYGDRIAQIVILPCADAELKEVEELEDTKRGNGGFGSTGY